MLKIGTNDGLMKEQFLKSQLVFVTVIKYRVFYLCFRPPLWSKW